MPAQVRRFGRLPMREPVLLELPLGRAPPQGALLEVVAEVRKPRGPDEGSGFDERGWLQRQGVQVVLRADHWRPVGRRGGVGGLADRLRAWLAASLAPGLEGERHAVLAGVVLGADEGLSEDLRDRFRASGLYHLLAVSGQNVAFIAGGVLILAWLLTIPRWLGELAVLAAIAAYVLAVGLQPSVVRAGVAGALASLAWLAARGRERWHFLLVGAAVLLAWNPYNLLEPGFQLSFTAVAAIFVVVPHIQRRLAGYPVPRKLGAVIAVSLACSVATAPILALQFGTLPAYSILANALAEPVVGPLLGLGLLTAVLHAVVPPAAYALAWANGWLAAYLAFCARLVGGLPHAQLSSSAALALLAGGILFAGLVWRLRPPRAARAFALLTVVVVGGLLWRLRPAPTPPPPPHGLRVTFLDVGQGDSALIQVPQGAILVDEGPPEAHVATQLRRLGLRRLSAVVLTHPQRDHVGGAADVLERLGTAFVLDPRLQSPSWDERQAIAAARRHATPVITARAGQAYRLGRLRLRVLWPRDSGPPGIDPNERAIVLLVSYGNVDALFTADAESNVTAPLRPPPVEILKVAHHGSADPGLPALLRTLQPRVAVISVGAHNDYGHPTPPTMDALDRSPGLTLYRTDTDGRVVVESDGDRLTVRSER
jgi:competence protein ComEC